MTETRPKGWLSKTLAKLTADDATIDAQELQSDVASAGCEPVGSCQKGKVVAVTGRLRSVVYTPARPSPRWRPSCSTAPAR
ncbi:hypothetical protein ACFQX8_11100 [Klenkia terrae]|uniref:hypothetical protein n=1 Tax=Klenkia terrae TaxID=1052259 RepID=UPI003620593A